VRDGGPNSVHLDDPFDYDVQITGLSATALSGGDEAAIALRRLSTCCRPGRAGNVLPCTWLRAKAGIVMKHVERITGRLDAARGCADTDGRVRAAHGKVGNWGIWLVNLSSFGTWCWTNILRREAQSKLTQWRHGTAVLAWNRNGLDSR
jgi:hypothetical protein